MIKLTKNSLFNPAEIRISGIKCSFSNIVKLSKVFDFKCIAVTVDSVTEESSLLIFVNNRELKYFARPSSAGYIVISVIVPCDLFEDFLDKAINEAPENIFVFNLLDPANNVMCLQQPFEELMATKTTDVFISISLDENALLICVNKSLILPQELFKRLKTLCFD